MDLDPNPNCYCAQCAAPLDWEDCMACGGDGGFDGEVLMDEDPLWYGPDDYEACDNCAGRGGWWYCPWCAQQETP